MPAPHADELHPARPAVPRSLKVIAREPFQEAVERAVAKALFAHDVHLAPERARAVERAVRDQLADFIGHSGRRIRGVPRSEFMLQLDRARDRTLAARDEAREELLGVQRELELARGLYKSRFEVLQQAARAQVDLGRLVQGLESLLEGWEGGGLPQPELIEAIRLLTLRTVHEEIERAARRQAAEYDQQVDRLERRIRKLSASLEATERALQAVSRLKAIDPGIASIYRTVQGLSSEDERARAKRAMLEHIYEANRVLQAR